jgi:RNA polymerase sigma-70 factor (ECF subfamily)
MSGERAQFEGLFRASRGPLLGYLSRRAPEADAADLLAEVYLVAWRRRTELPAGNEQRLWLFGVARRLLAEHHRIAVRRFRAEEEADTARPDDSTDDHRDAAVLAALDSLSELDRELVTLTTWEGLSPAEAARVVGITAGTARVRLHRARVRLARHPQLRALLAEGPDDGALPEEVVVSPRRAPASA